MEIADAQRPFVHPRRLTNVGEILKGEKKRAGKRKAQDRPKQPLKMDLSAPMASLAWRMYEDRRTKYLNDINFRNRELLGS